MPEQERQKPFNIEIVVGEDYTLSRSFTDSAGAARDVSGSTFYGGVFRDNQTTIDWTIDASDAVNGNVVFSIPNAITQLFTKINQKRKYEIWEQDTSGDRNRSFFGEVDILNDGEFKVGP